MPEIAELPGLDEAMAVLDAAEQAESSATVDTSNPQAEQSSEQPGEVANDGVETPSPNPSDTPAGAEPKPAEQAEKPAEAVKSKFAKDQERRDISWKKINEEKVAFQKQLDEFKQREVALVRKQEKFNAEQVKAKSKFSPEQYEQASNERLNNAQNLTLQADGMISRADKMEAAGDFAGAEKLRQQAKGIYDEAAGLRYTAKQYKDMAAHRRQNPDPTEQQMTQRRQQEAQHFTLEAAKHWPDLVKQDSQFTKDVAANLKEASKFGLDSNELPVLVFYAARLTAAETAAARVPVMDKELGQLRAKVKEYEKLTNPGGGREVAKTLPKKKASTLEEEGAELRQMAQELS